MTTELLLNLVSALLASMGAAFGLSFFRDYLSKKIKAKISVGGLELEIGTRRADELYKVLASRLHEMQEHPRVFVLYSHGQKAFSEKLATDLKSSGLEVWFDSWELKPGDSLKSKIDEGIRNSQWVVFVPPSQADTKSWVSKELQLALATEKEKERPFIIPVKHRDGKIPPELSERVWADFSKDYQHGLEKLLQGIIRTPEPKQKKPLPQQQTEP